MKVAIVTGVAGGIGLASAIMLAEKGYKIVGMGRSADPDSSAELEKYQITYVRGDVSSSVDRAKLFDTAKADDTIAAEDPLFVLILEANETYAEEEM